MKYEHPQILVEEPAPGHFAISNIPACNVSTASGIVVAPGHCYISPAVPTDLLAAIIAEREGAASNELVNTESSGEVKTGNADRTSGAVNPELVAKILAYIENYGTARIGEISDALGCTKDEIKALSGQGFEVANAGWVKLVTEGGNE